MSASTNAPSLPPRWTGGCALSQRQRPQSPVRLGQCVAYGDERRSPLRIELETRRTREGLHVIGGCLSGAGLAEHGVSNPPAATTTPSTGVRNPTLRQTSTRRERPFLPLRPLGRRGPGRGGGTLFHPSGAGRELRSLAYAPFGASCACARGRATRGRAVRSASQPGPCHGRRLAGCRARDSSFRARDLSGSRDAPWCGGGRGLGAPASPHAKRNPTDHDSRGVRALLDRAAAAGAARGRRCGHRRRRHHRRDHGPHPGARADGVLALGRRPLRQEHARPDPPTAGGRPRQRGVGAGARRAHARPRGAHPGEHLVSRRVRRTCAVRAFGAGGRRGDEGGSRPCGR